MGKGRPGAGSQRFRFLLELWLFRLVGLYVRSLSYAGAVRFSNFIGKVAFDLLKIRRRVTLSNLELAFGRQKSKEEREQIGRRSYQIISRSFVEHLYLPKLKKGEILNLVKFESTKPFEQALAGGKGAILVSAHFGSWQLFGVAAAQLGFPVKFLVQPQRNAEIDTASYKYIEDKGVGILHTKTSAGRICDLIAQNNFVAMLADQDAGRHGTIVNFLGQPASTHKGPAYFAIKTGAPIVLGFMVQNGDSGFMGELLDLYYPAITGDRDRDIAATMQYITTRIEEYVRKYPDHWFWPHRRWKSTVANV
ncbi:MAG: hypothetical protein L0Y74_09275 [candidate division Zixibacteria bacterium]|nr:hypothetical protein [candidate division Zixibacteria bacterium]